MQHLEFDGMSVKWDRAMNVKVHASGEKFGAMCGLCGNFDDDKSNDMVFGPVRSSGGKNVCFPDDIEGELGDLVRDSSHRLPIN